MKKLSLILCSTLLLLSCSTTKLNSYGVKNGESYQKIKTQAELVTLSIHSDKVIERKDTSTFGISSVGSEIILSQLLKLPEYVGKIIKDSKRKYTQQYNAKNTLDFNTLDNDAIHLPIIALKRKIFTANEDSHAISINFEPQLIDDNYFSFQLSDLKVNYTKAKTTKKYPFVNLNIVIKGTYYETKEDGTVEEKQYSSQAIVVPVKNGIDYSGTYKDIKIFSDPFKIKGLKMIEVEVTETNPYFLKLEEMETNLTDNEDNLTTILTQLAELVKAK